MSDFPVDDTTLLLLDAACQINPDNGQTNLMAFLDMGSRETSRTLENEEDVEDGDIPVYFVEHEVGYEPYSPHDVIRALIAEVLRLRGST